MRPFRCLNAALVALAVTAPGFAAAEAAQSQPPAAAQPAQEKKDPQKPDDQQKPEEQQPQRYAETVVVSASRASEKLVNAPATMSVVTSAQIAAASSPNFAELLRAVPGVNITQVSARDINVTSRGSTGTLATGQLALLDGRSLYQDFFGFVMWDLLPVNLNEVKQVEVIRGPASAVWGANAFNGVVNVITKSPREMPGTSAVLGFGGFQRSSGEGTGNLWYVGGTHAQAVNDRWAYKISGGGFSQDPFSRPTGKIPCDRSDVCGPMQASYPPFKNQGSTQPKFDARVDYDFEDGRKLSFTGGVAGTDGMMHSGIGPFDIESGTVMGYAKAAYTAGGLRAALFTNVLNGDATNLLSRNPLTGNPITFNFKTYTYDAEVTNLQTFANRHVVSYGGNLRFNFFDLSIAPSSDDRTEGGIFAQDEIFLNKMFRWVVGARVDFFDYIDDLVFSPRTTLMIKPRENHTFRVSYNRAYRSPSVINNHLQAVIAEPINLSGLPGGAAVSPYPLPINIVGNPDLQEQSLDVFEIGYSAVVKHAVISAAFYRNWVKNEILFTEDLSGKWSVANPPPNWPLPVFFIGFLPGPPPGTLPGRFTYLNFGRSTQQGFELGVNAPVGNYVDLFANYSWQGKPDPKDFAITELNLPATNRFNGGLSVNYKRYMANLSVSYSDSAFWQDVLSTPYSGTTDSYTLVNAGFGVKWAGDRLTTSIKATNLGNDDVQQHVFGDIVKRQIIGELRVNLK